MIDIFNYFDYRKWLKDVVQANRSVKGYKTLLATACQMDRGYLSRVLSESVHMSFDHIAHLSTFLELSNNEFEHLIDLASWSRSGKKLREFLEVRMRKRKAHHQGNIKSPDAESISKNHTMYYSSWMYAAIHLMVSIEKLQTLDALARELALPESVIKKIIVSLEKMGMVVRNGNKITPTQQHVFAPKGTVESLMHFTNWRHEALRKCMDGGPENLNFSGLYSVSKKDVPFIQQKIRETMLQINAVVDKSPPEEVVCLNVDYFRLTNN